MIETFPLRAPKTAIEYRPRLPLWETQRRALSKMAGKEVFALMMAMRTGKSATVLADFGQLEMDDEATDLLVISKAGVYRTWETAAEEHLATSLLGRLDVYAWRSGASMAEKLDRQGFLKAKGPRMLLMNCEALSLVGDARRFTLDFLASSARPYVVVDESTIIKNKSKRTKFINGFVRPLARYRRILSGLPTPRSPLDMFYQFEFLDWRILGHRSYYTFRNRYAIVQRQVFGGRSVDIVVGFHKGTEEELRALTEPHSFRVQFRPEVDSTWSSREVSLTPDQVKAYNELKQYSTTRLANESHVTASVVIAQIMRMHQVLCGHVRDEEGKLHRLPENRTSALLEELEEYSGKAVVWFTYTENLERAADALRKEYGRESVAMFYGGNTSTREQDERRFKTDAACRWMLATAGSGGMGRTWDVADRVVYFSNSDNLEHREQSEQRPLHVDKRRGVDYVDLIVPNTVDVKILRALRKKINMASAINGDNYKEWLI